MLRNEIAATLQQKDKKFFKSYKSILCSLLVTIKSSTEANYSSPF